MTIFDLVFIACFLAASVCLLWAAYYACRRRWRKSAQVLTRLGYGAAAYAAALVAVSLTSRAKVLRNRSGDDGLADPAVRLGEFDGNDHPDDRAPTRTGTF